MYNIQKTLKGSILTLVVDLKENHGPSKSGKTLMIASSEGNTSIGNGFEAKFGLNVYTDNPNRDR